MKIDFTMDKYKELCNTIVQSRYIPLCVERYLSESDADNKPKIILRHDVDKKPEQALKMAGIEQKVGLASTYYFRATDEVYQPAIIRKIADLGHEVGYHYEVLDKVKGDFEKAIRMFEEELRDFRKICDVKTICMHGNPLSKWVNKDLWAKYNFSDFGIIGEPYLSIDYEKVFYLTDTGRSWNSRFNVKDVVDTNINQLIKKIKNTDDVINLINKGQVEQICIQTHPNRWSDDFSAWLREYALQNIKNIGKIVIKRLRMTR